MPFGLEDSAWAAISIIAWSKSTAATRWRKPRSYSASARTPSEPGLSRGSGRSIPVGQLLIHGLELSRFLHQRRLSGKKPCPSGHLFCFKCRSLRQPAGGMVDYLPMTDTAGNVRAICPQCGTFMHRRVALAKLPLVCLGLDVAFPQAERRISETASPSLNRDLDAMVQANENAKPRQ